MRLAKALLPFSLRATKLLVIRTIGVVMILIMCVTVCLPYHKLPDPSERLLIFINIT